MVFTIGAHSFTTDDLVEIGAEKFAFTCTADGNVKTKYYPRATDPAYNTPLLITAVDQVGGTITVNVGATSGTVATAYPRSTDFISNRWIEVSNVTTKTFDVQVLDVIPSQILMLIHLYLELLMVLVSNVRKTHTIILLLLLLLQLVIQSV